MLSDFHRVRRKSPSEVAPPVHPYADPSQPIDKAVNNVGLNVDKLLATACAQCRLQSIEIVHRHIPKSGRGRESDTVVSTLENDDVGINFTFRQGYHVFPPQPDGYSIGGSVASGCDGSGRDFNVH